jgi:glycosyltransferase involved in cell wall biosynthesis
MTRVCHLTSVHQPDDVRIFIKECCSLSAAGFETHLVVPETESCLKNGVAIHAIPQKNHGRLWRMTAMSWKIYICAKSLHADIYHIHDPELLPYAILLKAGGKKIIYDVHEDVPRDIESKHWIPTWLRRPVSSIFEQVENICARRLTAVVTATPHIGRRFARINPSTITVNNYPIQGELHASDRSVGFSADVRPYVCYAGGIDDIRGAREMISAISRTDIQLLLAGSFSSNDLKCEVMSLPGWKQSFAGLILYHPETNHINAQPNKIFEYMSAGIPIIVSDFPLWRALVERIGCGICVDPFDVQAIADAITKLAANREQARAMGERGLLSVTQHYNWESEQSALINLYSRLVNN